MHEKILPVQDIHPVSVLLASHHVTDANLLNMTRGHIVPQTELASLFSHEQLMELSLSKL